MHFKPPANGLQPLFLVFNTLPDQQPSPHGQDVLLLLEGWEELARFYAMYGLPWTEEHLQLLFPRPTDSEVIKAMYFHQHIVRIR